MRAADRPKTTIQRNPASGDFSVFCNGNLWGVAENPTQAEALAADARYAFIASRKNELCSHVTTGRNATYQPETSRVAVHCRACNALIHTVPAGNVPNAIVIRETRDPGIPF